MNPPSNIDFAISKLMRNNGAKPSDQAFNIGMAINSLCIELRCLGLEAEALSIMEVSAEIVEGRHSKIVVKP